jgi:hypothetical protein
MMIKNGRWIDVTRFPSSPQTPQHALLIMALSISFDFLEIRVKNAKREIVTQVSWVDGKRQRNPELPFPNSRLRGSSRRHFLP